MYKRQGLCCVSVHGQPPRKKIADLKISTGAWFPEWEGRKMCIRDRSYENQRIPFSTLEVVIKMYATRFKDKDILNQTFFYPYPENLINITDSGKGRKL